MAEVEQLPKPLVAKLAKIETIARLAAAGPGRSGKKRASLRPLKILFCPPAPSSCLFARLTPGTVQSRSRGWLETLRPRNPSCKVAFSPGAQPGAWAGVPPSVPKGPQDLENLRGKGLPLHQDTGQ